MADGGSNINLAEPAAPQAAAPTATPSKSANEPVDSRKNFNYPLIKYSDMAEEMRIETMEMVVTAVEKYPDNFEAAAKFVKETMDKKCGSSWHVVVGEGFVFEITHEMRNLLFMFFGGAIGILVWKAS